MIPHVKNVTQWFIVYSQSCKYTNALLYIAYNLQLHHQRSQF